MIKKLDQLQNLASVYGFEVLDVSYYPQYKTRKGKTWGLMDRRNGLLVATSSTLYGLERYLKQRTNT